MNAEKNNGVCGWTVKRKTGLAILWVALALTVVQSVSAQMYTTLFRFTNSPGTHGGGRGSTNPPPTTNTAQIFGELVVSGNCLYGTTYNGGAYQDGSVFRLNTDGSGFTNLYSFSNTNLLYSPLGPAAGLTLVGATLYGTTTGNVEVNPGSVSGTSVFSIGTNGSDYTEIYLGVGDVLGSLVQQGDTLYGQSFSGGEYNEGIVFSVNTNGTFTDLYSSQAAPFQYGSLSLAVSGVMLFGTMGAGGVSNTGCIYSINTNGSNFNILYSFTNGGDGNGPNGVILSDGILYGTAGGGGSGGGGTVYSINTNGSGFKTIHSFTNLDGEGPACRLLLSGNTLYGTTFRGGISNVGAVFSVNTDGSEFTVLHNFTDDADGNFPYAGVTLSSNVLYGTTLDEVSDNAVIYKLVLPLRLNISLAGSNVVLTWPTNFGAATLQSTCSLVLPSWQTVSNVPTIVNNVYTVTNPVGVSQRYFRLAE